MIEALVKLAEISLTNRKVSSVLFGYLGSLCSWLAIAGVVGARAPSAVIAAGFEQWGLVEIADAVRDATASWRWLESEEVWWLLLLALLLSLAAAFVIAEELADRERPAWGDEALLIGGQYLYLTRLPAFSWITTTILLEMSPPSPIAWSEFGQWFLAAVLLTTLVMGVTRALRRRLLARLIGTPIEIGVGYVTCLGMSSARPFVDAAVWLTRTPWDDDPELDDALPSGAARPSSDLV